MNKNWHTAGALVSVLCWSSTFAVGRPLTETLGAFTATACMYLLAGLIGGLYYFRSKDKRKEILQIPKKYLLVCGGFFIGYSALIYVSIGLVSNRQQVIELGLINYLWPAFTVLIAVPLFGYRANWSLYLGIIIAFLGVLLSASSGAELSFQSLFGNLSSNYPAYLLAVIAAISWSLYSTLSRAMGNRYGSEVVPLYVLATGLLMLPFRWVFQESSVFSISAIGQLFYMAVFPTFIAYILWDNAAKRGDIVVASMLTFFTPLLATALSCLFLDLECSVSLMFASVLVLLGCVICRYSVKSS